MNKDADLPDNTNEHDQESRQVHEDLLRANAILSTQQETSPDGILVIDETGAVLSANRRLYTMWHIPGEPLSFTSDEELLNAVLDRLADPGEFLARVNYLYEHREEKSWEEIELKGGTFFERYSSPMYGTDGHYYGRIWYFRDITARKNAELAVIQREEMLRSIANSLPGVVFSLYMRSNGQPGFYYISRRSEQILGLGGPVDCLFDMFTSCIPPEDRTGFLESLEKSRLAGGKWEYEGRFLTPSGREIWIHSLSEPFITGDEMVHGGVILDITEQRAAEQAMRLVNYTVDRLRDGIFWLDRQARIYYVNEAACRSLGYSRDQLIGMPIYDIDPDFPPEAWEPHLAEIASSGSVTFESHHKTRDGDIFPIEVTSNYIDFEGQEGSFAFARDITEQKRSQQALQKSEETLRSIINSMSSVLVSVDRELMVAHWNERAVEMTGLTAAKALGRHLSEVLPVIETRIRLVSGALETGKPATEKKIIWDAGNISRLLDISVFPLPAGEAGGAVVKIDDITEQVKIAEIMQQTEKMLSIAGLAAGMAHEINNPLSGIVQGVQNILRRFSSDLPGNKEAAAHYGIDLGALQEYLQEREILAMLGGIQKGGFRASRIANNMLNFSRSSVSKPEPCSIDQLVEHAIELASNDYDLQSNYDFRKVILARKYGLLNIKVSCVETEIEQVFLNLLKNAAQAMMGSVPPVEDPRILINTSLEGNMAVVRIQDNGPGIDPGIISRIFEPFFSTKISGQGTGLGLSVSYFIIVEKHHGGIHAESTPGQGTTFIIKLPVDQGLEPDTPA